MYIFLALCRLIFFSHKVWKCLLECQEEGKILFSDVNQNCSNFLAILTNITNMFLAWKNNLYISVAADVKSLQLCPTLCDPIDGSPPGSSVPGSLQARILEWVTISFSNACMHAKSLQSCPTLCDPMDSSRPGSSVHGILQARILEWIAISIFLGSKFKSSYKWQTRNIYVPPNEFLQTWNFGPPFTFSLF